MMNKYWLIFALSTVLYPLSAPAKIEIFRNPYLAKTLEDIAAGGRDALYKDEIARNGGYQAIKWDDKNKVYSESRKDGQTAGY